MHRPHQPTDSNLSKSRILQTHASRERKSSTIKSYSRTIQTSWYAKYQWISVCPSSFKIFCIVCRSAMIDGLVTFAKHQDSTFTENGFSNWKKALQRFDEHDKSEMHREAAIKVANKSSTTNIGAQLSKHYDRDTSNRRRLLLKLLGSIRYLARQGLPFRGHREGST